jgi:hypothetical protein
MGFWFQRASQNDPFLFIPLREGDIMKKWLLAAAACAGFVPSLARAQEAAPVEPYDPNTGGMTLSGGVDYTTAYFFRGYNQEDARFIVQPWATIGATVLDSDNLDISAYLGTWNSLHAQPSGGDGNIYETDYYAGVDFSSGPLTLGVIYTAYTYPSDVFGTIQEFGAKLSYRDGDMMQKLGVPFALSPYVGYYIETSDDNAGGTQDQYLEVGIAPSFAVGKSVTIGVPVVLGMSPDHYYLDSDGHNEFFGYLSIGVTASIPLPLPAKYGAWSLTGGLTYLQLLADNVQELNDHPSKGGQGDGEEYKVIGKLGVSFVY